jgi:hypothetical protein
MFKKYLSVFIFIFVFLSVSVQPAEAIAPAVIAIGGKILGWGGAALTGLKVAGAGASALCAINLEGCISVLINYIFYWMLSLINYFAIYLVKFSGQLMDLTLYYTVAQFTQTFTEFPTSNNTQGGLIYYAWSLVRDLLNAGVFFIIIYHAIISMFNGFAEIKKKFIALLVFVVLVNFSLLFVKLIADISNIAILQIYEATVRPVGSDTLKNFTTSSVDSTRGSSLSLFIINAVNPYENLKKSNASQAVKSQIKQEASTFAYQLGLLFIYFYLFFIFLYISAILFTRAATFIVIMIASPLLVAGMFFSGLGAELKKAQDELFEEAFQGPGIIFFLVLSALIADALFNGKAFSGSGAITDGGANPTLMSSNIAMFVRVIFFAVFNFYAFKFIRQLTTRGNNFSEKLFGAGLGLAFGATAFGARKVTGLGLSAFQNSRLGQGIAKTAEKGSGLSRWAATKLIRGSEKIENASFNPLASKLGGSIMSMASTRLGMSLKPGIYQKGSIRESKTKKAEALLKQQDDEAKSISSYVKDPNSVSNRDIVLKESGGGINANLEQLKIVLEEPEGLSSAINTNRARMISDNNALPPEKRKSPKDLEKEMLKSKVKYKDQEYSEEEWNKLTNATEDESKKKKMEEILGILQDANKRAKAVNDYREKTSKDRLTNLNNQSAEGGRRTTARGMFRRASNELYNATLGGNEKRTHSQQLAQQMAAKRVKDGKEGTKQFARTVEKVVDNARGMLRTINNLTDTKKASLGITPTDIAGLKKVIEDRGDYKKSLDSKGEFNSDQRDTVFKLKDSILAKLDRALDSGATMLDTAERKEMGEMTRKAKQTKRETEETFETIAEKNKDEAKKKEGGDKAPEKSEKK